MRFLKAGTVSLAMIACGMLSGCATTSQSLYDAAYYNNLASARSLVAQGVNVNAAYIGVHPLSAAAQNGSLEMARLLLDNGGDPNVMAVGMTPLLGAIWKGKTEMVRLLVSRGANVNLASNWGSKLAPIHYCGAYGNAEIATILINAGADITARDIKGRTAVDYAQEYKKDEILAVLRKAGAPVSYSGKADKDVVMAALSGDRDKFRQLVEDGVDPNIRDKSGESLLSYAVENKWPESIELLVKKGADVNEKDKDGWTVMMKLSLDNQADALNLLKAAGVTMPYTGNKKDDLLIAVLSNDKDKVAQLLAQGADVNSTYRYNSPLLNYAITKGDRQIAQALIDHNANPNLANTYGVSPFLAALKCRDIQLSRQLMARGGDVSAKDANGVTALALAVAAGDTAFVKEMLAKGAQPTVAVVKLAEGRDPYAKNINFPEIAALLKPELLRRQMLRAQAAVETAQSAEDYQKAIAEYNLAKEIAPEKAEIYYNLGLVQEKSGAYADAISSLRKYLELAPGAPDSETVKDMIYKLEYKREQGK